MLWKFRDETQLRRVAKCLLNLSYDDSCYHSQRWKRRTTSVTKLTIWEEATITNKCYHPQANWASATGNSTGSTSLLYSKFMLIENMRHCSTRLGTKSKHAKLMAELPRRATAGPPQAYKPENSFLLFCGLSRTISFCNGLLPILKMKMIIKGSFHSEFSVSQLRPPNPPMVLNLPTCDSYSELLFFFACIILLWNGFLIRIHYNRLS